MARPTSPAEIRTSGALRAVGPQKKSPAAKTGLPAAMSAFLRTRSASPPRSRHSGQGWECLRLTQRRPTGDEVYGNQAYRISGFSAPRFPSAEFHMKAYCACLCFFRHCSLAVMNSCFVISPLPFLSARVKRASARSLNSSSEMMPSPLVSILATFQDLEVFAYGKRNVDVEPVPNNVNNN